RNDGGAGAPEAGSRFGIEQIAGVAVAAIGVVLLPLVPWFVFSRDPHPAPVATPVVEQPVAVTPPATVKPKAKPRPPAHKVAAPTTVPTVPTTPAPQPVVSQPQYTSPPHPAAPAPPAPVVTAPPVATPVTVPIVVPVTPTTGIAVPYNPSSTSHG